MKVTFESMGGTLFPVDIGESTATLQELKEKVEKALLIPKAKQILSFEGTILRQDTDLLDIKNGSVIKFCVAGEYPFPAPAPAPIPKREAETMDLQLAISPSETTTVTASGRDTIRELKEIIQSIEGTPADHILIAAEDGMEIPDYRRLRDYAITLVSGLTVEFLSFEAEPRKGRLTVISFSSSPSSSPRARKKSRLSVMSSASSSPPTPAVDADKISVVLQFRGENLPAPVEVGRSEMVRELRTRLETMNFKVPENQDYCFFHKLLLLDEDRSFASQNVADGDIISICSPGLARTGY